MSGERNLVQSDVRQPGWNTGEKLCAELIFPFKLQILVKALEVCCVPLQVFVRSCFAESMFSVTEPGTQTLNIGSDVLLQTSISL